MVIRVHTAGIPDGADPVQDMITKTLPMAKEIYERDGYLDPLVMFRFHEAPDWMFCPTAKKIKPSRRVTTFGPKSVRMFREEREFWTTPGNLGLRGHKPVAVGWLLTDEGCAIFAAMGLDGIFHAYLLPLQPGGDFPWSEDVGDQLANDGRQLLRLSLQTFLGLVP